ncbi:hypothetical protein BAUCODRAFT_307814 [Baudoinia panamericana UAMH 10762]|uniref:Uncharacterized protein n=1 Tax=Baudoinia panamericana (strain UAMH 10762) TaxID=717646 RepID=M2MZU7_BAUPA|nr:uncharacterized protein BAUCODRAFT_307814 [Baudoinia panamericana UAMH 10762]EMC91850.1 hypothetical protein BAUCODRAFT_307814 [Baudoinia panamericana UAMH 10762]
MDGLLINSEDLYTLCTNAILHSYGRPSLPWHIKAQLQGRPGPEAGKIFQAWAQLPDPSEVVMEKIKEQQRKRFPSCALLPGVEELLKEVGKGVREGVMEVALATSSHAGNFALKTAHLTQHFEVFSEEQRVLGDDPRIAPGRGKPAPDIYLLALKTINDRRTREGKREVKPEECLVFEDSVPGVEAGRRAGMQVVWCPHEGLLEEMRGKEDLILAGLMGTHEEVEEKNEAIGVMQSGGQGGGRRKGAPGEVGDGWGRLFSTLERFPWAEYGVEV